MHSLIHAKSSTGDSHDVVFRVTAGRLFVTCSCQRGQRKQLCDHVLAFLRGDESMLYDRSEAQRLSDVTALARRSGYADYARRISAQKRLVENESEKLRTSETELEDALSNGLVLGE